MVLGQHDNQCIMLDPSMVSQGPGLIIRPVKFIKNKIESGNESGRTCERCFPVGCFPSFVFAFDFIFDEVDRPDHVLDASMMSLLSLQNHVGHSAVCYRCLQW